ncbi:hypothetical protein NDU88_001511 [Pleurodeles waltl]|uniref:Uncharacterized protein n=1 Tax=Pleurodeles waltl TaxID=8319 RepID=A0AAV7LZS5_PLEWA|nr:hypothetical protein NDU88_001511 [Pleurodeles waltl]
MAASADAFPRALPPGPHLQHCDPCALPPGRPCSLGGEWRRRACRRGDPELASGCAEPSVKGVRRANARGEEGGAAGLAVRPCGPGGPEQPSETNGDTGRDPAEPVRERSVAEAWGPRTGSPWRALPLGPACPLLGLVVEPGCEEVAAEKRGRLASGLPAEGPGLVGVGPRSAAQSARGELLRDGGGGRNLVGPVFGQDGSDVSLRPSVECGTRSFAYLT